MVKTHRHVLIETYGMDAEENPTVRCACGRDTSADMCVDITGLSPEYRAALGLNDVDYLCDACQMRLFCDRHVSEDEFYALLGQEDVDALFRHNRQDEVWKTGRDLRHDMYKPKHSKVTAQRALDMRAMLLPEERVLAIAPIPLRYNTLTHEHSVQRLRTAGIMPRVATASNEPGAFLAAPPEPAGEA